MKKRMKNHTHQKNQHINDSGDNDDSCDNDYNDNDSTKSKLVAREPNNDSTLNSGVNDSDESVSKSQTFCIWYWFRFWRGTLLEQRYRHNRDIFIYYVKCNHKVQ